MLPNDIALSSKKGKMKTHYKKTYTKFINVKSVYAPLDKDDFSSVYIEYDENGFKTMTENGGNIKQIYKNNYDTKQNKLTRNTTAVIFPEDPEHRDTLYFVKNMSESGNGITYLVNDSFGHTSQKLKFVLNDGNLYNFEYTAFTEKSEEEAHYTQTYTRNDDLLTIIHTNLIDNATDTMYERTLDKDAQGNPLTSVFVNGNDSTLSIHQYTYFE